MSLLCVQVAKYLANPLCRGVYAGDSSVLSMRSCFPIFYNLEQNFTSIIIGSLLQKKGWSTQSIYNVLSHTCVVCTQRSEGVLDSTIPVEIYKKKLDLLVQSSLLNLSFFVVIKCFKNTHTIHYAWRLK